MILIPCLILSYNTPPSTVKPFGMWWLLEKPVFGVLALIKAGLGVGFEKSLFEGFRERERERPHVRKRHENKSELHL